MSEQRQKASVIQKLCGVSLRRLPRAHQTARTCQTLCLDAPKHITVGPKIQTLLFQLKHTGLFCGHIFMCVRRQELDL